MRKDCNICRKRILNHSYHLRCAMCDGFVHINCLPYVSKEDDLYVHRNYHRWFCPICTASVFPFNHFDDDDIFQSVILENLVSKCSITLEILNNQDKLFTPFELNDDDTSPLSDVDPDLQYYNSISNMNHSSCNYHLEDTFNNKKAQLNIESNSFSMIHTNIRSIPKNLNSFENYLDGLDHNFSIIGLSESWLSDSSAQCYSMQGFTGEHKYRANRSGGGVSLFIKDNIEYILREDLCHMNKNLESIFIEIDKSNINKDNNCIVGVIYRPPDTDLKVFNDLLNELLSKIKTERKLAYLLGDYNVNLLAIDSHKDSQEFIDTMYSFSLFPSITKPTRVTSSSATLIDNIFYNDVSNANVFTGILYTDITDHYPVFYIDHSAAIMEKPRIIKKTDIF